MWIRHLLALFVLPFTMTVLVPLWIARAENITWRAAGSAADVALMALGVCLLGLGLVLFGASLRRFSSEGSGTLAPWDPPRRLVVSGPYRYVRNPMISGVIFVLFGEALLLRSWRHGLWAATFLGLNLVHIPFVEEPQLERRFGADYREYCRHVRRIVPRTRPWRHGADVRRT
jgi:protein-S-isoprenylcysteine O-methyltransferase Ste14